MERGCHRIPAKTKMASDPASSRNTQNRVQELCEHREVMLSVYGERERSISMQVDPLLAYWWSLDPSKNKMFPIQRLPTISRSLRSCMNTEVVLGTCGEMDRLLAFWWSLDPSSNKTASDPASCFVNKFSGFVNKFSFW